MEGHDKCSEDDDFLSKARLVGNTYGNPVAYRVGDDIVFEFHLESDKCDNIAKFSLEWFADCDDGVSDKGVAEISVGRPCRILTHLSRPGFVHVRAKIVSKGVFPLLAFEGGAGAEIDKIHYASTVPHDFDEYWTLQRAMLDKVPMRADIVPFNSEKFSDGVAIPESLSMFSVRVDCRGDNPVTGYLSVPKAPGKYRVACVFDGYSTVPQVSHRLMLQDAIVFHVNAHGYELGRDNEYYSEFFKRYEKNNGYGLDLIENSNPDTSYFNGMAARVMRAFDFVKTLDGWNGTELESVGRSQGGLQSIWAASLVPGLTRCESSITWCSNIAGAALDHRLPGWHPDYVRGLDYYDAVFHAARIPKTCFVDISRCGLGDYTCPPSGITALFNNITAPKHIAFYQNSTHMFVPENPTIVEF